MRNLLVIVFALGTTTSAFAQMRVTEWMYSGNSSEFIEFTNIGAAPIDMTGWSFDDDSRTPGTVSLSGFGIIAPGASALLIEATDASLFRTQWAAMPGIASVPIIAGNPANLGRNDEINLYDHTNAQVDRLTFGDQNIPGSIRTQNRSGWVSFTGLGANDVFQWTLSSVGDLQGSVNSATATLDTASPGRHVIPEPASLALLAGAAAFGTRRRRA